MKNSSTGLYQLKNGNWGYRYGVVVNGQKIWKRCTQDNAGNPFTTQKQAITARALSLKSEKLALTSPIIIRHTLSQIYDEYAQAGRTGKAYATIVKQDSLWNQHIKERFGDRYIETISVVEINDYLSELYYQKEYSYQYIESFLKIFYLLWGQAYTRNYLSMDSYNKMCMNKSSRIHMPPKKTNEEDDIVIFSSDELATLDEYFKDTNAETAYMIGRYTGLRINECYGLKWDDIDLTEGIIHVRQQMQYQEGLIKLVPLKTLNAKRDVYMNNTLLQHLNSQHSKMLINSTELSQQRTQNSINIPDVDGTMISSLSLVNSLPNGKIQTINSMKYHAVKIRKSLDIHFRFHYLRHTYGSSLANLNIPSYILCKQMGHGNINVTMKYYLAETKTGIDLLKNLIEKI